MKTSAIIPSGGIGSRFNSPIPKQYLKVLGKELITYTLNTFQHCEKIDEIIIPAHESYFDLLNQIKTNNNFYKISKIVKSGKERQDSVYNGLIAGNFEPDDLVLVHDAARPLLSRTLLEKVINLAWNFDSVVVGIKARDTLFSAEDFVSDYLDRSKIYYAQTPQIFRYRILKKAFDLANENGFYGTDESMLVKQAGFDVKVVDGEFENFKITSESDLEIFKKLVI